MLAQTRLTQADEIDRMVADIGIPPCPTVLATLIREARADEPDFGRVSELISSDVGLSAAMLKVANSALYGAGGARLDSVRQAVMRIGLKSAVQLVTGLLLRQAFPADGNDRLERFWESSSRIAALSAHIAVAVGSAQAAQERELAHTFSLFRDCGSALMLCRFTDYPSLTAAAAKLDRRLTDLEQVRYGFSHAQVGFELACSWLLNDVLCKAVLHHHSQDAMRGRRGDLHATSMRLIAIAAIAENVYCMENGEAPGKELARAGELSLMQFDLAPAALRELAEGAEALAA
jgi:HD-like signal output (HDOD) protein